MTPLPTMIRPPQSPGWRWPSGRDDVNTIGPAVPIGVDLRAAQHEQRRAERIVIAR